MIERIKNELRSIEEAFYHMDMNGIDDYRHYAKLCKKRRILKMTLRMLEKLEVHSK